MTRTIVKTVIENYVVEGHTFRICKDDAGAYWGFNKNKTERTEWNGINGHREEELNETLRKCYLEARFENEIDREKYSNLDLEEVKKFTNIIEESLTLFRQ